MKKSVLIGLLIVGIVVVMGITIGMLFIDRFGSPEIIADPVENSYCLQIVMRINSTQCIKVSGGYDVTIQYQSVGEDPSKVKLMVNTPIGTINSTNIFNVSKNIEAYTFKSVGSSENIPDFVALGVFSKNSEGVETSCGEPLRKQIIPACPA